MKSKRLVSVLLGITLFVSQNMLFGEKLYAYEKDNLPVISDIQSADDSSTAYISTLEDGDDGSDDDGAETIEHEVEDNRSDIGDAIEEGNSVTEIEQFENSESQETQDVVEGEDEIDALEITEELLPGEAESNLLGNSYETEKITLSVEDGVLTVGGLGMLTYDEMDNVPYYEKVGIKKIVIKSGITGVESGLFNSKTYSNLEQLVIADSVNNIGYSAFSECVNLKSITLPANVVIEGKAFEGCTGITSLIVKDGTTVNYDAFHGCTGIKSVEFGSDIVLGDGAFDGCEGLLSLELPEGLTFAEDAKRVFRNCKKIRSLQIPSSITVIPEQAFRGCTNLTEIYLPDNIRIKGWAFAELGALAEITLPDGVELESRAFCKCPLLEHVILPASATIVEPTGYLGYDDVVVNEVGYGPFVGCKKLISAGPIGGDYNIEYGWTDVIPGHFLAGACVQSIDFPNGISRIGGYCFANSSVNEVVIPTSVNRIGDRAFNGCLELTHVVIPNVELEGNIYGISMPFYNTPKLKSAGSIGSGCDIEYGWQGKLPAYAFTGTSLENVSVSEPINEIGESAFSSCYDLKEVSIGGNVRTLGFCAFSNCKALEKVTISEGVQKISAGVFSDCESLKILYLPRSISSLSEILAVKDIVTVVCDSDTYAYKWAKDYGYTVKTAAEMAAGDELTYVTISFEPNGGTGKAVDSISVARYSSATIPACSYTKEGYEFAGWNTKADGSGSKYLSGTTYTNVSDSDLELVLYAQWKKVEDASVITYVLNGGKNNKENVEYVKTGKKFTFYNPTKNGYTFAGWYTDAKFKTKITQITGKKGKNYTLYAKWNLATYTVKYVNPKGTTAAKKNPSSYKITDATKTLNAPSRKGFTFTGWYKDSALTQKITEIPSGSYGNITLYSGWTPNVYTVSYDGNGATGGSTSDTTHGYLTYGNLANCGYTKTGYSFVKWYKNAKCTGTAYAAGYAKNDFTFSDGVCIRLYAKWTPNKYSVIYDGNGATSGKTNKSTFTFNAKNKFASCGFKRVGYTFAGWSTTPNGGSGVYKAGSTSQDVFTTGTDPVTLYAQWTPVSYWITFSSPARNQKMENIKVAYDQEISLPRNTFEKAGYTFAGWTDSKKNIYADCATVKNLSSSNNAKYALTPVWTYKVYYDANGGTGVMEPSTFTFNKTEKLATNQFVMAGYSFNGWKATYNKKNYSYIAGASIKNLVASDSSAVTLVAQWKPITYEVWFEPNTGNTKYDKSNHKKNIVKCTYNASSLVPKCKFTNKGYVFDHWNSKPDGTGTRLDVGGEIDNLTNTSSCIEYYAIWKPDVKISNISFNIQDLTIRIGQEVNLNDYVTIEPSNSVNKNLTWKSSNAKVAKVSSDGKITGVKEGTVTVAATTSDGSKKSVSISIIISTIPQDEVIKKAIGDLIANDPVFSLGSTMTPGGCHEFAGKVYGRLFGTGVGTACTFDEPRFYTLNNAEDYLELVGVCHSGSSIDDERALLRKARPGDVIRYISSSTVMHTAIIYDINLNDNTITLYHNRTDNKVYTVHMDTTTLDKLSYIGTVTEQGQGLSLYRNKKEVIYH